jgi:hypothetical protein
LVYAVATDFLRARVDLLVIVVAVTLVFRVTVAIVVVNIGSVALIMRYVNLHSVL